MASDLLTRIRGEIDVRLRELRPALEEHERLLAAGEELDRKIAASKSPRSPGSRRTAASRNGAAAGRARAPRGAAQEAIVAALEHGSHTVSELAVVTAMSAPGIRQSLRRLVLAGAVTQAKREGKLAYALAVRRR
jgi:hypothetical protein